MNLNHLSASWSTVAPAIANHLWQSTLFLAAAGLLTLLLRKNHARVRYWLWLAASVKFMIPFSLLVSAGQQLAWSHRVSGANAEIYFSLERFSQPFSQPPAAASSTTTLVTFLSNLNHLGPVLIVTVWFWGFAAVLLTWTVRWRRISNSIRQAVPVDKGREIEALRRVERAAGARRQIPLLVSDNSREPGIFGITRPVLVWPHGISDRLEDAHLKSILAHELCHVRRQDNLAAAAHMAVEAIFWFHPLVWWVGHRLVEERELACDEAVLEMGSERQVYAESILKICEFCVGSPLNCVSGVTGADLKKRIAHIMTEDVMDKLNFGKKLLLCAAGLIAIATPLIFGLLDAKQAHAQPDAQSADVGMAIPAYEHASIKLNKEGTASLKTGNGIIRQRLMIKPGEFTATNASLQDLLRVAFGVADFQIAGVPVEFNGQLFNVDAKANKSVGDQIQTLEKVKRDLQNGLMAQAFLENSLHLRYHRETKELAAYSLVVATAGKLHEDEGDCPPPPDKPAAIPTPGQTLPQACGGFTWGVGRIAGSKVTAKQLITAISSIEGRMVVDKTSLSSKYDIVLAWSPAPVEYPAGYSGPRPQIDPNGPTLEMALQQQLGLKLEPQTSPVEVLVIDHAELPAEN